MSVIKPYQRLWRPLVGYDMIGNLCLDDERIPSTQYLNDNRFVCQLEMNSLVIAAHLIIRDLYEIFNFVEPNNANLNVFSQRIYELFLRTVTEFESNCKGVLRDNGYPKEDKRTNIFDYYKINIAARLSEYEVVFNRWDSCHIFTPFSSWNAREYSPLSWYQCYNTVKHNRYSNFYQANLINLMNAVAGLLCILHAQFGENMNGACFEGVGSIQVKQEEVRTNTFTIKAPNFPEDEWYEFAWGELKTTATPVQNYIF